MNEKVAPIPAGFTTITPHLLVKCRGGFCFLSKSFWGKRIEYKLIQANWLLHLD